MERVSLSYALCLVVARGHEYFNDLSCFAGRDFVGPGKFYLAVQVESEGSD